jgi:poly(A) polymerase
MTQKTSQHPNLIKNFPLEVQKLFQIFLKKGDEIRLVGGCVRDLLIQKSVNDFDFATKLLPEEIIKILQNNKIQAIPTGIKFGTITAVVNHKNFEITTLRKGLETDGRHCQAEFVDDYFLDAARRDFTINALYLDNKGCVTDYFDGISDLQNQKVKFIGKANDRIEEDFLRILRFFRFSCDYAKKLDEEGLSSCILQKTNIKNLSRERVRVEFLKLLSSSKKQNLLQILKQIEQSNIASEIFSTKLNIKALETLFEIENKLQINLELNLKIASLFLTKQFEIKSFAKEICATNKEKQYLQFLLKNLSKIPQGTDLKLLLAFYDKELVKDLYLFSLLENFEDSKVEQIKENLESIQNFSLPPFPIGGDDVMLLGLKKEKIGNALKAAKEFWALNDFSSSKEELINFLKQGGV